MARALIYLLLVAGAQARGTGRLEVEEAAPVEKVVEKAGDGVTPNDRKGKCKHLLYVCIYIGFMIYRAFFSLQCVPNCQVPERGVHHQHRGQRDVLHRGRVHGRRGRAQRGMRLIIRSLLSV